MVRTPPDTTKEQVFFVSRSKYKNPRAAKRVKVTTISEKGVLVPSKTKRTKRGNPFQVARGGIRSDLNINVRSSWEANVLRVLNLYRIGFQFEPRSFVFPANKTGQIQSYLPDIYLPKTDEWLEVKGYLDAMGRSKLRRFKKHYPEEFAKLTVIISKSNKANRIFFNKLGVQNILFYEHLMALYSNKTNWEGVRS